MSILKVQEIQHTNSTSAMTIGSDGGITNSYSRVDWSSTFKVGVLNSNYTSLQSYIDQSAATNTHAYYQKISEKMIMISFYIYKNSHSGTWNAAYGWGIPLPNAVVGTDGVWWSSEGAYPFLTGGYTWFNGTNWSNSGSIRWQANSTHMLSMYGTPSNTNWTSGTIEFHGHGILMLR